MIKPAKIKALRYKNFTICIVIALITFCNGDMYELIEKLKKRNAIESDVVIRTMLKVDRQKYCPNASHPYADMPQPIGYGAFISAPHIHAHALEFLKQHLLTGTSALDIGSGSGYMTVCMAIMLKDGGMCTGIEHIPEIATEAHNNTEKNHKSLINGRRLKYIIGDGRKGYKEHAPYDAIYAGANFIHIPGSILEQLKPGGRFVGPIGDRNRQYLTVIDKDMKGQLTAKQMFTIRFYDQMLDKDTQLARMSKTERDTRRNIRV